MGKVILKKGSSVWFNSVVRGDNDLVTIGENSNIQDGSVLHTDDGRPLTIGRDVTVGHMVRPSNLSSRASQKGVNSIDLQNPGANRWQKSPARALYGQHSREKDDIGLLCMRPSLQVMLHGCEIGDGSLIGIGTIILNGAKIGKNCLIGANSFISV